MNLSDPVADMLTRIRNAQSAGHEDVSMPHSRMKSEIARVLKREGFIRDYLTEGGGTKRALRLFLKYTPYREPVIRGIRRVSKPGLRQYVGAPDVPRVLGGLGMAILSTSSGIVDDKEARKLRVGGEVVCYVW